MTLRLHSRGGIRSVRSIVLHRAEGKTHECITAEAKSYQEANALLKEWANTAPTKGRGYHKTDITITWSDGFLWQGTYDLTRKDATKSKPIQSWVSNQWAFIAGLWKPTGLSSARYKAAQLHVSKKEREIARQALEEYEL